MNYEEFERRVGYTFKDKELLKLALTHSSAKKSELGSNERLEFLGDAVIELAISEYLCKNYPELPEGDLSIIRSLVVRTKSLAIIATKLDIEKYLITGNSLQYKQGLPSSVLANAVEAVAGAIFLDSDYRSAKSIVCKHFSEIIKEAVELPVKVDYKALLQQYCQQNKLELPVYTLVKQTGPEHQAVFEVAVEVSGKILGYGVGRTKKEAEQEAAKLSMAKIQSEEQKLEETSNQSPTANA